MAKKVMKTSGKILLILLGIIVLFLLVLAITNQIAIKTELSKIEDDYGQSVEVFGKNMRVDITGSGEDTIVLLPGLGIDSPIIFYRPLAGFLSENYTVITVEYFGYGLSDPTDRPRTVENISEELHEALSKLGYDNYILMPHSLSGLVSVYYANQYPDEVVAVAGLDTTVSAQYYSPDPEELAAVKSDFNKEKLLSNLGLRRFTVKLLPDVFWSESKLFGDEYGFSQEDIDLLKNVDLNTYCTRLDNTLEEIFLQRENMDKVSVLTFPNTIPVIFFLAEDIAEVYASIGQSWEDMHEDLIADKERSRIILLDGGHMVMLTHPKEIAEEFNLWYQGLEQLS